MISKKLSYFFLLFFSSASLFSVGEEFLKIDDYHKYDGYNILTFKRECDFFNEDDIHRSYYSGAYNFSIERAKKCIPYIKKFGTAKELQDSFIYFMKGFISCSLPTAGQGETLFMLLKNIEVLPEFEKGEPFFNKYLALYLDDILVEYLFHQKYLDQENKLFFDCLKLFLQKGSDPNVPESDSLDYLPLHAWSWTMNNVFVYHLYLHDDVRYALYAESFLFKVLELLLDYGASVDATYEIEIDDSNGKEIYIPLSESLFKIIDERGQAFYELPREEQVRISTAQNELHKRLATVLSEKRGVKVNPLHLMKREITGKHLPRRTWQ